MNGNCSYAERILNSTIQFGGYSPVAGVPVTELEDGTATKAVGDVFDGIRYTVLYKDGSVLRAEEERFFALPPVPERKFSNRKGNVSWDACNQKWVVSQGLFRQVRNDIAVGVSLLFVLKQERNICGDQGFHKA
jgi:hypothetical protein